MTFEYYIFLSAPDLGPYNTIKAVSPDGQFLGNLISPGLGGLAGPDGLDIGNDGNLYVGTVVRANILSFQPLTGDFVGEFITSSEFINAFQNDTDPNTPLRSEPLPEGVITLKQRYGELGAITGLTFGPDGNIYVSNFESITGIASFGQPIVKFDVQDSVLVFDGTTGDFVKSIPIPINDSVDAPFSEGVILPDSNFPALPDISGFLDAGNIPHASLPLSLAFDQDGNLYIPTRIHDTVYRYNSTDDTVAPFITQGLGGLDGPSDIQLLNDKWYVTSLDSNQILRYNLDGSFDGVFADFNDPSSESIVNGPTAISLTPDNQFFIITAYNSVSTVKLDVNTGSIVDILTGPGGNSDLGLLRNSGLLVTTSEVLGGDPNLPRQSLYVSNVNNTFATGAIVNIELDDNGNIASASPNFEVGVYYSSILEFNAATGEFLGEFVPQGSPNRDGIYFSSGITFKDNILYANDQGFQVDSSVTDPKDSLYGRILKFDATTGQYLGEFISATDLTANGLNFPEDLLFGPDGDLYISGLGGGGVQKFDGTTGEYEETIVETNPFNGKDLIIAGLNLGADGYLYMSSVLNDNSILRYNFETKEIEQFVPPELAPDVPSGTILTPDGKSLLGGTFLSFDNSVPVNIKKYDAVTGEDLGLFLDPSNTGGLTSASRLRFDENGNLYVSDFSASQIMKFDSAGNPVNGGVFVASDVGGLYNPGGLAFASASEKRFDILSAPMYRFRNTSYETGAYLFVGKEERDNILANPQFSQTFVLESESPAFEVSFEPVDDLLPFYRLQSLERPGQYLFVGEGEYEQIFAENSDQRDKWVGEGLDSEGNDQPDFYTYGAGADQGSSFNRFRNQQNGTYLFAGVGESNNILNDPSLSSVFALEGVAFESIF